MCIFFLQEPKENRMRRKREGVDHQFPSITKLLIYKEKHYESKKNKYVSHTFLKFSET